MQAPSFKRWTPTSGLFACRQNPHIGGFGNLCRRVASNEACPNVPPQSGDHECAWSPPGLCLTDTMRSAPSRIAGMLMAHHAGRPIPIIALNGWPWASPRFRVSRSLTVMLAWPHLSQSGTEVLCVELNLKRLEVPSCQAK